MNDRTTLLDTLTSSEMFQTFERAFSEITGMPVVLRPAETWRLPFHGKRKEASWCSLMAEKSTCAACLQMQEQLARSAADGPSTATCAYGLSETAVPVKLGARTIGFLQTGQVMRRKPSAASYRQVIKVASDRGVDMDSTRARNAYFNTSVVSKRKLDSVVGLLTIFADHLSVKANQIAIQATSQEPPVIAQAKQYMCDHYAEDLSLGQVASAVNTSFFYFCKLFRKKTGTTFTEFLSRTRVEKAKNLLLNQNLRISEIAYEVGFQSLTHFNRTFKNIVGESPTSYRSQLPSVDGGRKKTRWQWSDGETLSPAFRRVAPAELSERRAPLASLSFKQARPADGAPTA